MKKLLLIILLLVAVKVYSQSYSITLSNDTVNLVNIYNALVNAGVFSDSIITMQGGTTARIQYYEVAVKCNDGDSLKVSYDDDLASGFYTKETAPIGDYLGYFTSEKQRNIWFYTSGAVRFTVSFLRLIR